MWLRYNSKLIFNTLLAAGKYKAVGTASVGIPAMPGHCSLVLQGGFFFLSAQTLRIGRLGFHFVSLGSPVDGVRWLF